MALKEPTPSLRIELIDKSHPGLPEFFRALPVDSGWPEGTVLSLTDREITEFERADQFIAALVDERIIGALSLHPSSAGNYHRLHNLHFHIDILPAWQGKGVGTGLMERLLAFAREQGYWRIYLGTLSWNMRALALFGRFGFRVEGVSKGAYKVKTQNGDSYFTDGIGMALWIGPRLIARPGEWRLRVADPEQALAGGIDYDGDARVGIDELVQLYRAVEDPRYRFPELLKTAWGHSDQCVTARREGKLIGMARGITDRGTTFFVCDVLVQPEHQRKGIGRELMRRLVEPYRDIYQIVLITDPDILPFYTKLGYLHWESACLRMHRPGGGREENPPEPFQEIS
jgi:GNAT superfamily N-acetyltransferase